MSLFAAPPKALLQTTWSVAGKLGRTADRSGLPVPINPGRCAYRIHVACRGACLGIRHFQLT